MYQIRNTKIHEAKMDRLEGRNRLYNDNGWRIDHILGHKANLENINGTQLNGIYILKFFFPEICQYMNIQQAFLFASLHWQDGLFGIVLGHTVVRLT